MSKMEYAIKMSIMDQFEAVEEEARGKAGMMVLKAESQDHRRIRIIPPTKIQDKKLPPPSSESSLGIKEGRYICPSSKKGREPVTNFIINSRYLLRDSKAPKRVMELINVKGEKVVICCPVKALTSPREFSAIVEGKGNYVPAFTSSQFSIIKEYLYEHEETAEEITVLVYQP